jgi:2-methylcitrate dehydratase
VTPDPRSSAIAEFTAHTAAADLRPVDVARLTRHHLDAVGCALGGLDEDTSRIGRAIAASTRTCEGASVIGIGHRVSPEHAAFAGSCLVRQLDFNDSFRGGGHPSDMMPAVMAAAELVGAPGLVAIRGMFIAYEVFAALEEAYPFRRLGWDHGPSIAVGAAMGSGAVLGLDVAALVSAVGMALTPTMALRVSRTGELSNWKGCATASAAAAGLFAARLAQLGMTGPAAPFDGTDGLHRQVSPRAPLTPGRLVGGRSAVQRSSIKRYPVVTHAQGVVESLLDLRARIDLGQIDTMAIDTYHDAWTACGGGSDDHAEKWRPTSRETADHSLPYACALALIDGDVRIEAFTPERMRDPRLHSVMDRISVEERADLTEAYPDQQRSEIRVRTRDGDTLLAVTGPPLGTPRNPLTDDGLTRKFRAMAWPVLGEADRRRLENTLWDLPVLDDVAELTELYRSVPDPVASPTGPSPTPPAPSPTSSGPGNGVRKTRSDSARPR